MKAEVQATLELTIKLSREEAEWLHAQMQNPLQGQESELDKTMRSHFFDATDLREMMGSAPYSSPANLFCP